MNTSPLTGLWRVIAGYLPGSVARGHIGWLLPLLFVANVLSAIGQLNGTYTVGGSNANYRTISEAIIALNTMGVSGPVTFTIAGGTYIAPPSGWTLGAVAGMSAANRVTFRPASGATVVIQGQLLTYNGGIFTIAGGKYFTIDGSNNGGSSRDLTLILTSSDDAATVWINDGSSYNTIKNCRLQATIGFSGGGIVTIGVNSVNGRNDSNAIVNCQIGDPEGTYRSAVGIYVGGWVAGAANIGTRIVGNEIINLDDSLGREPAGIYLGDHARGTIIDGNVIHQTRPTSATAINGIRILNLSGATVNTRITANSIYALVGRDNSRFRMTTCGISLWDQAATVSSTLIANNMISIEARDGSENYGIRIKQNFVGTKDSTQVLHNSINVTDGGSGASTTRMLQRDNTTNNSILIVADNVFYSQILADNDIVHALYLLKTDGLISDYNLLDVGPGTGSNVSRILTSTYRTLAEHASSTLFDAHSVMGNPKFIDPAQGDLHISTTRRTPVSGNGMADSRVSIDIDGGSRASSPDLGADEGSFLDRLANDIGLDRVEVPLAGRKFRAGSTFTPSAIVENLGTSSQSSVPVRCRIIVAATGAVVYDDVQTIGSMRVGERRLVTFGQNGNVQGSTSLQPGTYVAIVTSELTSPADQEAGSDSIRVPFEVGAPLSGTYTIDLAGGPRSFGSIGAAVNELLALGVSTAQGDSAVTFLLAGGRYDGAREHFPIRITRFVGGSSARTVSFRPFPNASVVIEASTTEAAIDLSGCSHVKLDGRDGSINGGSSWTIVNRGGGSAVTFSHDATHSSLRHLTLQANNTSMPDGSVVTFETPSSVVASHGDTIMACTIGDTSGAVRSLCGIVSRGAPSIPDGEGYRDIAIIDNDVVNFSITYDSFVKAYGIGVMAGARWTIHGNRIHNSRPAGEDYQIYVGIGCDRTAGVTVSGNHIFDLRGRVELPQAYGIVLMGCRTSLVHDNFVSVGTGATENTSETDGILWYPLNGDTLKCYHNTVHIPDPSLQQGYCLSMGSTPGIVTSAGLYSPGANASAQIYNNVFTSEASGGALIYRGKFTRLRMDYNLLHISNQNRLIAVVEDDSNASTLLTPYFRLGDWSGTTGFDIHSVTGPVRYRSGETGDLHIDSTVVFRGEGAGATSAVLGSPYPYLYDIDRAQRDTATPDMGADDGNFNGGGISLISPNGGEQYPIGYELPVRFTLNRPMIVAVEFSTDAGATWAGTGEPLSLPGGGHSVTIITPDLITGQARIRVVSRRNQWEADTSDGGFSLVLPVFTLQQPNGGEIFTATDTTTIRWTGRFLPPQFKVQLDYSIDGGTHWLPIATGLSSLNLPDTNSFEWVLPNTPSNQVRTRVKIVGSTVSDRSDQTFTIRPMPRVEMVIPNGDDDLFVGEQLMITWTSSTTDNIYLHYSIDGGTSWLPIGTTRIPAGLGSFPWRVPNTPSGSALVRVVNAERPRFTDASDRQFAIRRAEIEVLSPNGGEGFEVGEPITIRWRQSNVQSVRVEYSADYGASWTRVADAAPAAGGSYTFTPTPLPTKLALMRLTDAAHEWVADRSDRPFEILQPKGIVIFTPAVDDKLIRRSTSVINWQANRIDKVDLQYSLDNGGTWSTIANGIAASVGSYVWQVPNQLTDQGRIRIRESNGAVVAERGLFRIIDATLPVVKVIRPNGGERYTSGGDITVQWNATADIISVALSYSSDNGATWSPIAGGIPGGAGQYLWKSVLPAGTRYRVKVDGAIASDISDGAFEVVAKPNPRIVVIRPNGGETVTIGGSEQVAWSAADVPGEVLVDYSTDDGATWSPVGGAAASAGSIAWTVQGPATELARVRVTAADASAADASDAPFAIRAKQLDPLRIVTPNTGTEIWQSGEVRAIVWESPADVPQVKLSYSLDGGIVWTPIIGVASVSGANTYQWQVPAVTGQTTTALIRVEDASDPSRSDISDREFTIRPQVSAGVAAADAPSTHLGAAVAVPNPSRTETEIHWMQERVGVARVRVVDEVGRAVIDREIDARVPGGQSLRVRTSDLSSGAYYVIVEYTGMQLRGLLMVSR